MIWQSLLDIWIHTCLDFFSILAANSLLRQRKSFVLVVFGERLFIGYHHWSQTYTCSNPQNLYSIRAHYKVSIQVDTSHSLWSDHPNLHLLFFVWLCCQLCFLPLTPKLLLVWLDVGFGVSCIEAWVKMAAYWHVGPHLMSYGASASVTTVGWQSYWKEDLGTNYWIWLNCYWILFPRFLN